MTNVIYSTIRIDIDMVTNSAILVAPPNCIPNLEF